MPRIGGMKKPTVKFPDRNCSSNILQNQPITYVIVRPVEASGKFNEINWKGEAGFRAMNWIDEGLMSRRTYWG